MFYTSWFFQTIFSSTQVQILFQKGFEQCQLQENSSEKYNNRLWNEALIFIYIYSWGKKGKKILKHPRINIAFQAN